MSAPTARRWSRRSDARPDEILDAALEEFETAGFDSARMEDVARRAGISKAGVYLYFDSKEALLKALIHREVTPIAARVEALAKAGQADPASALQRISGVALVLLVQPRIFAIPRLVISIAQRFPDIAALYRTEVVDRLRAAMTGLIRSGIALGQFRTDIDPELAIRTIVGPIMFEALWRNVLGGAPAIADPEAFARRHIDHVLHGLAAPRP
jgi:AcrR family transcriptional regulator